MTKTLSITKARKELPTLVDKANRLLDEYVITVKGFPAAVLISASEYESWKETNEITSDSGLMKSIKKGEENIAQGKYVTFEQLKRDLRLNV